MVFQKFWERYCLFGVGNNCRRFGNGWIDFVHRVESDEIGLRASPVGLMGDEK
jgi:hypothetical protein